MTSTESRQRAKQDGDKSTGRSERTRRGPRASAGGTTRPTPPQSEDPNGGTTAETPPSPNAAEPAISWSFRDFLVPNILLALSAERAHGYVIEQYLRGIGLVNVELSTLYRTLRQLEKDGLVYSVWEPGPEGPARRIYNLTDTGRWWLDAGAAALQGYRTLIDRFFGSYSPKREPNHD